MSAMAVGSITLKYIEQDLEACRVEIARIDEQMVQFKAKREALVFRLEHLATAFDKEKAQSVSPQAELLDELPDSGSGMLKKGSSREAAYMTSGTLEDLGFRDAVRQVLADASKGMRPKEIVVAMQTRGFNYSGKTDFSARMANELSRMVRSRGVRKRGHLYYSNS